MSTALHRYFTFIKSFRISKRLLKISNETQRIAGEYAQIACNITSEPPPIITWFNPNGTEIDGINDKMGIVSLLGGSTLKIRNLVPEDSGIYKCLGQNFMGEVEGEISLVVEEAKPEGDGYLLIVGTYSYNHNTVSH